MVQIRVVKIKINSFMGSCVSCREFFLIVYVPDAQILAFYYHGQKPGWLWMARKPSVICSTAATFISTKWKIR